MHAGASPKTVNQTLEGRRTISCSSCPFASWLWGPLRSLPHQSQPLPYVFSSTSHQTVLQRALVLLSVWQPWQAHARRRGSIKVVANKVAPYQYLACIGSQAGWAGHLLWTSQPTSVASWSLLPRKCFSKPLMRVHVRVWVLGYTFLGVLHQQCLRSICMGMEGKIYDHKLYFEILRWLQIIDRYFFGICMCQHQFQG